MFNVLKYPAASDGCFRVDMIEAIMSPQVDHFDPLESLVLEDLPKSYDAEVFAWMNPFGSYKKRYFEELRELKP